MLLSAPAGRGKSALLARWVQRLQTRDDVTRPLIIFVPVSVRFNLTLGRVVFAALAARLADVFGENLPDGEWNADTWRDLIIDYLQRTPPAGRTLLVVLDGADEAADWQPSPDLFPLEPPTGLRLVLSVRWSAAFPNPDAWLRHLEWERFHLAQKLVLAPLNRAGVAQQGLALELPVRVADEHPSDADRRQAAVIPDRRCRCRVQTGLCQAGRR